MILVVRQPAQRADRRGITVPAWGMLHWQIRWEPSDNVVLVGCWKDCSYEVGMVQSVEGFERSIAIATVRKGGGRGLMKPVAILCASVRSAEVLDLWFRKPCWVSDIFRCRLWYGKSNHSRTLNAGQRREIGRQEVQRWQGLPTLGMGII